MDSLVSCKYSGFAPALKNAGKTFDNVNSSCQEQNKPFNVGDTRFSNLPHSREEILQVAEQIRENHGEASVYLANDATKKIFKQVVQDKTIIHIATHSIIHEDEPELSGLLFYPDNGMDEKGSGNSGLLLMNEIFNLKIKADLVILSACGTGSGKITRSEGILALNRAFYCAGASNIIYTLWNITDAHTKDFMTTFFDGVISGQSFSAALRNTKLQMIHHPETSLPKLWAGYVLLGR